MILTARPGPSAPRRPRLDASIAAFDALDFDRLGRFFDELPRPIDHVMVTGPGPYYAPLADFDFDSARRDIDAHLLLPMHVARTLRARSAPVAHCCSSAAPAPAVRPSASPLPRRSPLPVAP